MTFADEGTPASVGMALNEGTLTSRLRAVMREQDAEPRTAIMVRAAARPDEGGLS